MKLLKLYTTTNDGRFNQDFNEDIIIEPHSQLALNTVEVQKDSGVIVIDETNDTLTFKVRAAGSYTATIKHGKYFKSDQDELYDEIMKALNMAFIYSPSQVSGDSGFQWKVSNDSNNKTQITIDKSELLRALKATDGSNWKNINVGTSGNRVVSRNGGTDGNFDSYVYFDKPIARGVGLTRVKVRQIIDGDMILGLGNKYGSVIDISSIKYGVRVNYNATPANQVYSYILNGVETPTPIQAFDNDWIELDYYNGNVHYKVHQDDGAGGTTTSEFYVHPHDIFKEPLYSIVIMLGSSNNQLGLFSSNEDPYVDSELSTDLVTDADALGIGVGVPRPPAYTRTPGARELTFANSSLSSFLGFENLVYSPTGAYILYTFQGERQFNPEVIPKSLVVMLDSIQLDSYDGRTKKRANILGIVPNENNNKQVISYQVDFPIFIDVKNISPQYIRNLQVRLVEEDGNSIITKETSSCSILIKDKSEK